MMTRTLAAVPSRVLTTRTLKSVSLICASSGIELEQGLAQRAVERVYRAIAFRNGQPLLPSTTIFTVASVIGSASVAAPLHDAAEALQLEQRAIAFPAAHQQQFERAFCALVAVALVFALRDGLQQRARFRRFPVQVKAIFGRFARDTAAARQFRDQQPARIADPLPGRYARSSRLSGRRPHERRLCARRRCARHRRGGYPASGSRSRPHIAKAP